MNCHLDLWPQYKWVSRTRRGTFLFQVYRSQLHQFLRYSVDKQTDTQTNGGKTPIPLISISMGTNFRYKVWYVMLDRVHDWRLNCVLLLLNGAYNWQLYWPLAVSGHWSCHFPLMILIYLIHTWIDMISEPVRKDENTNSTHFSQLNLKQWLQVTLLIKVILKFSRLNKSYD